MQFGLHEACFVQRLEYTVRGCDVAADIRDRGKRIWLELARGRLTRREMVRARSICRSRASGFQWDSEIQRGRIRLFYINVSIYCGVR
jgi:hypothetical protein